MEQASEIFRTLALWGVQAYEAAPTLTIVAALAILFGPIVWQAKRRAP